MKTKTFQIHPELIKESIVDLVVRGKKVTKKNVLENINNRLFSIISSGNVDVTVFCQSNFDDFRDAGGDYSEIIEHYNRIK